MVLYLQSQGQFLFSSFWVRARVWRTLALVFSWPVTRVAGLFYSPLTEPQQRPALHGQNCQCPAQ